jgi:hypothetical protein
MAGFRPAATTLTFSTQASWHFFPSSVVGAANNMANNGYEQLNESKLHGLLESPFCFQY